MYPLTPTPTPTPPPSLHTREAHPPPHHPTTQPFTSSPEDVAVVADAVARLARRLATPQTSTHTLDTDTQHTQTLTFCIFDPRAAWMPVGGHLLLKRAHLANFTLMGFSSFPWDAGDPTDEDVAAAAVAASRNIHTMIIMRQSSRESHVLVAADQTTGRDDKLMVVLLLVSAGCCGVENNESPWRSTCGCQTPSEAAGMEEEPVVVVGSSSSLPGPQVNLGLTTITEYSSYSKLWRMLQVPNDAAIFLYPLLCSNDKHFL